MISRNELNKILNDPARLTKLLQRHVVQDLIYTSGLQGFQKAYALDFEILYIYHAKGNDNNNKYNRHWRKQRVGMLLITTIIPPLRHD